ncbi:MAG TPA: hypothetical protein VGL99_26025, partial [Chloroflexota bacterium]
ARITNTAAAFEAAEAVLMRELPHLQECPAPLVVHLTDGMYTRETADPAPVAKRIKDMRVSDGNVLIETIFISDAVLPQPIRNILAWGGIMPDTKLADEYAEKLRAMSSILPERWRLGLLNEHGYQLQAGAVMLLPGTSPELVSLAFQMSGFSGIGKHA